MISDNIEHPSGYLFGHIYAPHRKRFWIQRVRGFSSAEYIDLFNFLDDFV